MVWVGRSPKFYMVHSPPPWAKTPSIRPANSFQSGLNTCRDTASTVGNLHQCLTTPTVKNFFPIFNLNQLSSWFTSQAIILYPIPSVSHVLVNSPHWILLRNNTGKILFSFHLYYSTDLFSPSPPAPGRLKCSWVLRLKWQQALSPCLTHQRRLTPSSLSL